MMNLAGIIFIGGEVKVFSPRDYYAFTRDQRRKWRFIAVSP